MPEQLKCYFESPTCMGVADFRTMINGVPLPTCHKCQLERAHALKVPGLLAGNVKFVTLEWLDEAEVRDMIAGQDPR